MALWLGAAPGGFLNRRLLIGVFNTLVELLSRRRNIIGRVKEAEVKRTQLDLCHFNRHNGKVLNAWVVSEAKGMPDDDIFVPYRVATFIDPRLDARAAKRLIGVVTRWEQLTILVFGDPDWALTEL